MTAKAFFETNRDAEGRAWVGSSVWLDVCQKTLRLNGPGGVMLVGQCEMLETALRQLEEQFSRDDVPPHADSEPVPSTSSLAPASSGGGSSTVVSLDESQVVEFGVADVDVAEWFGMNLNEAMAVVGVEAGDRSGFSGLRRPTRGRIGRRKQCQRCGALPTVFLSRRRVSSSNVDFTIGQWRRTGLSTWAEKGWVCRHYRCDYREMSEGTYDRSPHSIQF